MCKSTLPPYQGALNPPYHSSSSSLLSSSLLPFFLLFLPLPTGIPTPLNGSPPTSTYLQPSTNINPPTGLPTYSSPQTLTYLLDYQHTALYQHQPTYWITNIQLSTNINLPTGLPTYSSPPTSTYLLYQHNTPILFQLLVSDNSSSSLYPLHPANIPSQSLPTPNPDTGSRPPSSNREGG